MAALVPTHDHLFILRNLVAKDFKVRYRNMSLGILWSFVNPLVMMGVLSFVFTMIFGDKRRFYPLFLLIGLLPFNFFSLGWSTGTNSVVENGSLVKHVPLWRELLPISVVLGNALHFLIQMALLLLAVAIWVGVNPYWLWLPVITALEVVFVCGLSLLCSGLDVYYRDMRYVVESANLVLFWMVPIFYSLNDLPQEYVWIYQLNPIATVIFLIRRILLHGLGPHASTMVRLIGVSFAALGLGAYVFRRVKRNFTDYL